LPPRAPPGVLAIYAAVVSRSDPPRLLAARSERAYTERVAEALPAEPEAVSADEQRELSARAHRRWQREQKRAWGSCHASIRRALSEFQSSGPVDRGVLVAALAVERAARRVDRRVDELGRRYPISGPGSG
jgi:hypothetical protein